MFIIFYKLLFKISENEVIDPEMNVSLVEGRRIQVLTRSNMTSFAQNFNLKNGQDPTNLDELTNQVFEDLLQNKNPELIKLPSDQGSIKVSKSIFLIFIFKDVLNFKTIVKNSINFNFLWLII